MCTNSSTALRVWDQLSLFWFSLVAQCFSATWTVADLPRSSAIPQHAHANTRVLSQQTLTAHHIGEKRKMAWMWRTWVPSSRSAQYQCSHRWVNLWKYSRRAWWWLKNPSLCRARELRKQVRKEGFKASSPSHGPDMMCVWRCHRSRCSCRNVELADNPPFPCLMIRGWQTGKLLFVTLLYVKMCSKSSDFLPFLLYWTNWLDSNKQKSIHANVGLVILHRVPWRWQSQRFCKQGDEFPDERVM